MDDGGVTRGVNITSVTTLADGGDKQQQTALVQESNLSQFIAAKTAAGADIETIELKVQLRNVKR